LVESDNCALITVELAGMTVRSKKIRLRRNAGDNENREADDKQESGTGKPGKIHKTEIKILPFPLWLMK